MLRPLVGAWFQELFHIGGKTDVAVRVEHEVNFLFFAVLHYLLLAGIPSLPEKSDETENQRNL